MLCAHDAIICVRILKHSLARSMGSKSLAFRITPPWAGIYEELIFLSWASVPSTCKVKGLNQPFSEVHPKTPASRHPSRVPLPNLLKHVIMKE